MIPGRMLSVLAVAMLVATSCAAGDSTSAVEAPSFATIDGSEYSVADLAGEPAVVFFWAPG